MASTVSVEYYPIASACSQVEAIRIQMLLDRSGLEYRMHRNNLYSIYGDIAVSFAGPIQFLIPRAHKEHAEALLLELFSVDAENLPHQCPACEATVLKGVCDCPNCGLFLG
ncbi:MAG: hypothetical protein RLZZ165_47 [Bacteroidota bacterium]|jgi:hypothetical protein